MAGVKAGKKIQAERSKKQCLHKQTPMPAVYILNEDRTYVKEFRIKRTAHIVNLTENTDTPEKARTLKKKATLTKLGDRKPKI